MEALYTAGAGLQKTNTSKLNTLGNTDCYLSPANEESGALQW